MLIEFRVANHRSIRDEQAFTMQADDVDPADPRPRHVSGFGGRLLPAAALYGANASGKSNVLSALGFMRDAVLESQRAWPPEGGVPRDPFAWGGQSSEPSLFEVTLLIADVRYRYGFLADDLHFVEEWLYASNGEEEQSWFVRDDDRFSFGDQLLGENRLIEQVTRPNALFLSAAVQLRHQQLGPLYGWFRNLQAVNIEKGGRVQPADRGSEYRMVLELRDSKDKPLPQRLASFVELLRAADVGIMDLKTEETDQGSGVFNGGHREIRLRVLLRHRNAAEETWLPLEQESQGTRTLYQMGNILLDVLGNGGLLLVDELEAHLHPILALQILRQFNDTSTNSHNAQILFTTHDTHLLGTILGDAPLRRDQVWLTEKDSEGATCLYPLTDYKPRPSENLERGYLQGRYGAIPFLGDLVKSRNPADGE